MTAVSMQERVIEQTAAPVLSVIIPVFNEAATLPEIARRIALLPMEKEILVVDDASTDGSAGAVQRLSELPGVRVHRHDRNCGKGAAIRTALAHAQGSVIVIQDADLEYDPADIERIVAPILSGDADVVFGSRFLSPRAGARPSIHRLANRFLSWLSNRFTGLALTDMETCYKAMRREVAASLTICEDRFGVEPEITAKVARGRWTVREVPISYRPRKYAEGKKIGLRDGLRAVWCIVRYSLRD